MVADGALARACRSPRNASGSGTRSCTTRTTRTRAASPLGFDEEELGAELLADAASRKAIDGCWRIGERGRARARSLLTQRGALARAADGVLDADEQALLLRPRARGRRVDRRTTCRCSTRRRRS